ncbi:hypothetical protein AB0J86_18475 [Micromonospora sp. NPDC049559]|uniref:WXG100 family type VII secretion target n=1 Tax=Micromonospora sp. NPDC049559 TaxID=3155923 RepID=UPI00341290B2
MSGDLPTNVTVPGSDDQYRKPQEAGTGSDIREGLGIASTFLMPVGGSFVEDLISDGRKVDEKDPSWEEIITMVVIPGRPASIRNASQIWSVLFKRMESAAQLLEDGIKDLKSWEGQAGEAYRANLTRRVTDIRALIDKHKSITTSLDKAAGELETAIKQIPIPDDMAHEVAAAQVDFANTGQITNGIFSGGIFNKLLPIYSNKWFDELREAFTPDWAANKLRDWISDQDDKAKQVYRTLAGQHVATMDGMPQAQTLDIRDINDPKFTPTTTNPTGKPPSIPQAKQPTMPDPKTTDPFSKQDFPSATDPSDNLPTTPPDAWSKPPSSGIGSGTGGDLPGTGLAGAGGGGLSGAGAGGIGAGGGLPGGGAGLGAGTAGVGGPGTGMMGAGMAGAGAGAGGRGSGAGRGGTGRSGLGAMAGGGGHGGAGGGDGDEYSTWLSEDEDVWGSDTDAAPPVLGA